MNIKFNNLNLLDDIDVAKKIVTGDIFIVKEFDKYSSIYKTTNENIAKDKYHNFLKDKKRVLSVIGSGDQILNSILLGAKEIVGLDISTFPKYFLLLKLASIYSLSKDEYLDYFYGRCELFPFDTKYYEKIRENLEENSKEFWDSLYNNYDYNILYNSNLFYPFDLTKKRAIRFNPFLLDDNYDNLKEKINNINIDLYTHNMFDVNDLNIGKFDLAILSNILNYVPNCTTKYMSFDKRLMEDMNIYKKFLKKLPLNKKGVAISYNFVLNGEIKKYFKEKKYNVYEVDDNLQICSIKNEILIYNNSKKLQLIKKK